MLKLARGLLEPKTFCVVLFMAAMYVVAAWLLPKLWLAEVINGLLISAGGAVVIAYGPTAFAALRDYRRTTKVQYLGLGVVMIVITVILFRLWSAVYLNVGQPAWMEQHWLPYSLLYMTFIAFVFLLRAPATLPGNRTRRSWHYILWSMMIGLIIAVTTILIV